MQSATSLLLMTVLLACPLVCRWQACAAVGDSESRSGSVCPHCCPCGEGRSPSPVRPAEDRAPGTDCICNGAICGVTDATPAVDVEQPTDWLDGFAVVAAADAASGNRASFDESARATSPLGGRAMRLLMASLRF